MLKKASTTIKNHNMITSQKVKTRNTKITLKVYYVKGHQFFFVNNNIKNLTVHIPIESTSD